MSVCQAKHDKPWYHFRTAHCLIDVSTNCRGGQPSLKEKNQQSFLSNEVRDYLLSRPPRVKSESTETAPKQ